MMSLDDFEDLLADQPEDERWELISGRVVRMMVGARWEHSRIISNLHFELRRRFADSNSPCRVFTETFRLKEQSISSSLLSDIIVHRGGLKPRATSLNDPTVVFEVLSDGTRQRDRHDKWSAYQRLASLQHYVLVERDRPHIEVIDRVEADWSNLRIADGLDSILSLPAIGVAIPFAEIYADVLS